MHLQPVYSKRKNLLPCTILIMTMDMKYRNKELRHICASYVYTAYNTVDRE